MLYRLTLIGLYNYDKTIFDELTFPDGIDHQTAVDAICIRGGEMGCIYTNPDFLRFAMRNWSAKNREPIARILRALTEDYNPIHNYDRYETSSDTNSGDYTTTGRHDFTNSGENSYTDTGSNSFTEHGTNDFKDAKLTESTEDRRTNGEEDVSRNLDATQAGTTTGSNDRAAEELVSADNASTYQPDRQTIENATSEAETTGENHSTENEQKFTHGTDHAAASGTEHLNHAGADSKTHSGEDQLTHTGTDQMTHSGTDSTTQSGTGETQHEAHLYGNIGITTSAQMIEGEMNIRLNYKIYDIVADMFVSEFCELTY